MDTSFDAIIIGSGIGGLTCGSLLSKLGNKKVLVLEKHFKAGGFTHTFKREGKFLWDVGVHYIGDVQKGSMSRKLFDLITDGKLDWNRMPEPFEKFVYPDATFSLYGKESQFREELILMFSHERKAIERYIYDVKAVANWASRHFTVKALPLLLEKAAGFLSFLGDGDALMTTQQYLEKNIQDPTLRAVLASQWGDYGLPPSKSAFAIHALIVNHYFNGGYYPKGSAAQFAETIKPVIEARGGRLKVYSEVVEILIQNYKAIGVKVLETKGHTKVEKEYFAPIVISDAGAFTTYNQLLSKQEISFREQLNRIEPGVGNVTLYVGFKESPLSLGVKGENYWFYPSIDHEANFANRNNVLHGKPSGCYVSFPSLKDTESTDGDTGEVISFVDYEPFSKWRNKEWKNRGEEYQGLKARITDGLLEYVDKHLPGFSDLVEYKELSTPVTSEYFTGHRAGGIYGVPCTPGRFRLDFLSPKTPIENLYLTGADACTPGVVGAMMGGFSTSALILGVLGVVGILKESLKK
jgi:all-trans-retinol 13,14-reductase